MNTHLTLPSELLLQRFQCQQVVAEDQPVVEEVVLADPMRRVMTESPGLRAGCAAPAAAGLSLPIQVSSSFCLGILDVQAASAA